jgi:hypothetical protein
VLNRQFTNHIGVLPEHGLRFRGLDDGLLKDRQRWNRTLIAQAEAATGVLDGRGNRRFDRGNPGTPPVLSANTGNSPRHPVAQKESTRICAHGFTQQRVVRRRDRRQAFQLRLARTNRCQNSTTRSP